MSQPPHTYSSPSHDPAAKGPSATPEITVVLDFLRQCIPFDGLPDTDLRALARQIEVVYCRTGSAVTELLNLDQETGTGLILVRSGALDIRTSSHRLLDRLAETDSLCLDDEGLKRGDKFITVIEDSLLYCLGASQLQALRHQHRHIDRFFLHQSRHRLHTAEHQNVPAGDMMRPIKSLMSVNPLTVTTDTPIQAAAQLMSEHRISSVLVVDGQHLKGILTDRDIRSRAVAVGLDTSLPVALIMTPDPVAVTAEDSLFDAVLLMTRQGIHHLPVLAAAETPSGSLAAQHSAEQSVEQLVGMMTASDIMLARQNDPVYLVQHISRQTRISGIQTLTSSLPSLLVQWQQAGMRAHQVSHILTAISDAVAVQLIELAISKMGSAPVPFCWLGFGSQGRGEQLLGADQDNGLVIADELQPSQADWFAELARFVCDGLNQCGYKYCPGDIMATTADWRQTLSGWQDRVAGWVNTPTPDAVMRISIFFDIRAVYGDQTLCRRLQQHMLQAVTHNQRFLTALAENVVATPPPLGLFRTFVVEHSGEHEDQLDLKKRGLLPLIEVVRIHALAHGVDAVNTEQRLNQLVRKSILTAVDAQNLQDALRVLTQIRLQNQAGQIQVGAKLSNYLAPQQLSQLQRKQLKDAFAVVSEALRGVRTAYLPLM